MKLEALLPEYRADLAAFLRRHASRLLRYEGVDDLVQGVHVRALEADFTYRGREPFLKWLHTLARQHLADRRRHWAALKRRPAGLVRLTRAGSHPGGAFEPAADGTGPITFADRREQLARAVKALAFLSQRDRALVQMAGEGVPLAEQAQQLDISYDAAKSASRRALDRYRGVFERLA